MSGCGCSIRTPSANALGSSATPRAASMATTSRAEWPVASTTASPVTEEPSARTTPAARPPLTTRSTTRAPKRTSTPTDSSRARIALTTTGSLFEPMCGRPSIRMASGAPCSASTSMTSRTSPRLCARVYSFPSEYVPAPPSPKQ